MKFSGIMLIILSLFWWFKEFGFSKSMFYCFYKDGFLCSLSDYSPIPLYVGVVLLILGVFKNE